MFYHSWMEPLYLYSFFFLGGGGQNGGRSCHSPSDWLWHAGEIWGCVTLLALSLDGVPLFGISQYCPVHQ